MWFEIWIFRSGQLDCDDDRKIFIVSCYYLKNINVYWFTYLCHFCYSRNSNIKQLVCLKNKCSLILSLPIDSQVVNILSGSRREIGKNTCFENVCHNFVPTTTHLTVNRKVWIYLCNDFLNQIRSIVNFKVHDVYNFNEVIIDFEQPFNIARKVLIF